MEEMQQNLTTSRNSPLPENARYSINNSLGTVSDDSLQEILSKGIGRFVICEMLIGVEDMVTRQGLLTSVGKSYFVLYNETNSVSTVCDIYSLKFAHFLRPGLRPYATSYQNRPADYLEVGEGFGGQEIIPMSLSTLHGLPEDSTPNGMGGYAGNNGGYAGNGRNSAGMYRSPGDPIFGGVNGTRG